MNIIGLSAFYHESACCRRGGWWRRLRRGSIWAYPPFYLQEPLEQFYPAVMGFEDLGQRATYRAPWPVSRFCLIDDATREAGVHLVFGEVFLLVATPC